jgi:hypothetical protein
MKLTLAGLLVAGVAVALGAGPVAAQAPLLEGFTCCNLHHDGDWISDANWSNLPMIPAGTPIKITFYGYNHRAFAELDGRAMRIGHDYGRAQESLEKYVSKLVVPASPATKIEGYPKAFRDAIRAGRVETGMTREQAIIAAGYPATHKTPSLDAPVWNYWASRAGRYEVHWNAKGTVQTIVGRN